MTTRTTTMTDIPDETDGDAPSTVDPARTGLSRAQRIGIGLVLLLAAGLGLTAGAGLSFGDIRESVEQRLFGDPEPDLDRAGVVASDSSAGYSVEVLLAPTDRGGGECVVVEATGHDWATADDHASTTWCWFEGPATPWGDDDFQLIKSSDRFGLLIEVPLGPIGEDQGAVALVGAVHEDVEAIGVEFGDGNEYTFNLVTDHGWFAVILPSGVVDIDRVDGGLVNGVVALEMVDIEGRVLATATPNSNWF